MSNLRIIVFLRYLYIIVKRNIDKAVIGLFALFAMSPLAVSAQEVDSLYSIAEFEVTAHLLTKEVAAVAPMQQMHTDDFASLATHTAADAMRHFAGVSVKDYGGVGGLKTVSVRGLGATHTAVSYDGVVVGNCMAGQIDLGRFAANGLESISLHVGQADDMLSSARALASGGLVSMVSRRPQWNDKCYLIEEQWQLGSFGYVEPSGNVYVKLGENTWTGCSYVSSYSHGRYPYQLLNGSKISTEQRSNTDVTQLQGDWELHHQFKKGGQLDTKLYAYASERGLPGAVILYNSHSTERLADRNFFAQARYSTQWDDRWQLQSALKYTYGWNQYVDTNVKYEGGSQIDENLQHEYYAQATLLYRPTTEWTFSLAEDGLINTLSSNLPSCPFPTRFTSLTAMQAQYRNHWLNAKGMLLGTVVSEHSPVVGRSPLTAKCTPSLSVSLRPSDELPLYLRMLYKNTFRMPTFNELYYLRSGNRSLRPESANEYNMGITWQLSQWGVLRDLTITADGYFNQVKDKIVAFPTTYVWRMANYGRVHIAGLDAVINGHISMAPYMLLTFGAGYTLQHVVDLTDSQSHSYGCQLPYTPKHSGSARLQIDMPWFDIGYSVLWSGERYSMAEQIARYRLSPYAEHTMTLSKGFPISEAEFMIRVEAINFTNAQYQIIQYYPMPGRQFRATLSVNL